MPARSFLTIHPRRHRLRQVQARKSKRKRHCKAPSPKPSIGLRKRKVSRSRRAKRNCGAGGRWSKRSERLEAPPEPNLRPPVRREPGRGGKWPSYHYCLTHAPLAHGGDKPDISRVDFTWALTALDWGHSVEATADQLMIELHAVSIERALRQRRGKPEDIKRFYRTVETRAA